MRAKGEKGKVGKRKQKRDEEDGGKKEETERHGSAMNESTGPGPPRICIGCVCASDPGFHDAYEATLLGRAKQKRVGRKKIFLVTLGAANLLR